MKPLVLVGLMGSGKSTVGALGAQRSGREFVDVDAVITARMSKTVRELWEEGGEAAYRYLESDIVLEVSRRHPNGAGRPRRGGARSRRPRRPHRLPRRLASDHPSTLAGRVRPGDHRPLLGDEPAAAFPTMAEMRSELYRQVATAIIDTDGLAPEAIADAVLGLLGSSPADA